MVHDLVIRNASTDGTDDTVDIGIKDAEIVEVSDTDLEANEEIDAGGNLVAPGFVDAHMHIDRAFAARGERKPKGSDRSPGQKDYNELFDAYYEEILIEEIEERAVKNIKKAVRFGSVHLRTHVAIDHPTGLGNMRACLRARERTKDIANIQIVPWSARGILHEDNRETMREAIKLGLENGGNILVGGADPASRSHNVERTIDIWLDLAEEFDVGLDPHIQDPGTLGTYTLNRLLDKADKRGIGDRITASHCFCLGNVEQWHSDEVIERFEKSGAGMVTCYSSTRCSMPLRSLLESDVPIAHGTDNDQDFVTLHGHSDPIEGLIVQSNKLNIDGLSTQEYRWFQSNSGLEGLWDMITHQGSEVMDLPSYGTTEGSRADLVVLDEPSPQWAIAAHGTCRFVMKDGSVVAEEQSLTDDYVDV